MQAQAGLGVGVVGDLGAPIRIHRRVGFARGHHRNSARHQQRAQPHAERQRVGLLRLAVAEAGAGVVAAVGRIQHHHKARSGGIPVLRGELRAKHERSHCKRKNARCAAPPRSTSEKRQKCLS